MEAENYHGLSRSTVIARPLCMEEGIEHQLVGPVKVRIVVEEAGHKFRHTDRCRVMCEPFVNPRKHERDVNTT
jgi:hypothetical protein